MPSRSRWRVAPRWPTGPNIWSRRSTSLTGRPSIRAASTARICGPARIAFDPKPPPRNGLRSVTFSGGMPKKAAKARCAIAIAWFGVSSVSRSPSHAATIACGSMAL